ncbi:MAG: hypothetical protein WCF95_02805 [bacterium]
MEKNIILILLIFSFSIKVALCFDCENYQGLCIAKSNIKYQPIEEQPFMDANFWAGARDACENIGGRLPTKEELEILYRYLQFKGVPYGTHDFWSSTEYRFKEGAPLYSAYYLYVNGIAPAAYIDNMNKRHGNWVGARCVK